MICGKTILNVLSLWISRLYYSSYSSSLNEASHMLCIALCWLIFVLF